MHRFLPLPVLQRGKPIRKASRGLVSIDIQIVALCRFDRPTAKLKKETGAGCLEAETISDVMSLPRNDSPRPTRSCPRGRNTDRQYRSDSRWRARHRGADRSRSPGPFSVRTGCRGDWRKRARQPHVVSGCRRKFCLGRGHQCAQPESWAPGLKP